MVNFFRGFKDGARQFADLVADSINLVLLFVVYFLGVGLTNIFARLFQKKFLDIKPAKRRSYWAEVKAQEGKDNFTRIF